MNRRGFLLGLGASLITAPAIVRAASLMPVKAMNVDIAVGTIEETWGHVAWFEASGPAEYMVVPASMYADLVAEQRAYARGGSMRWGGVRIIPDQPIPS